MSRNPGYSRAGANGGYANGNGNYAGGGYNGYTGGDGSYDNRPSGERPRRPGGYGGMSAQQDDYAPRPSNERERPRRPGGYGGLAQEDDMERRPSADRERRPGGYGGGGFAGRDESPRQVTRPTSIERSPAKRRSGERQNGSRPRNANNGQGSQAIEEVLQYIQQNWEFMTKDQCVPIEVALKLMDSSSLGLANQAGQFQQTHDQLQNALKGIVNEHHQGFNSSIGTFHQIQSSLQSSQHRVRTLKGSLVAAKSQLSTAKPELKEFATTSQNYDEMLQMLDTIEKLQLVPERLEARISEKRFLTAVDILQDALRIWGR